MAAARKPPANESLKPGFRLSRYTILRRLSAGGFGVVYVARREDGKLVAIKEYLPATLACRTPADKGRVKPANPSATRPSKMRWEATWYSMPVHTSSLYTKGRDSLPPLGQLQSSNPPSFPMA